MCKVNVDRKAPRQKERHKDKVWFGGREWDLKRQLVGGRKALTRDNRNLKGVLAPIEEVL